MPSFLTIYETVGYLIKNTDVVKSINDIYEFATVRDCGIVDDNVFLQPIDSSFGVLTVKTKVILMKNYDVNDNDSVIGDNTNNEVFMYHIKPKHINMFMDDVTPLMTKHDGIAVSNEDKEFIRNIISNPNVLYGKMMVKYWP